jgi:hypothetical protein
MARKHQLEPLYVRVCVAARLAGAGPAYLNATLLQQLLTQYPDWTENLLSVRECLFTIRPNDRRFPRMTGETVFAFRAWDTGALAEALSADPPSTGSGCSTLGQAAFDILGVTDAFDPGIYSRLELDLRLPARHFAQPRAHLEHYLRGAYLPYSLRRVPSGCAGETCYHFEVPKKGLKKKILWDGTLRLDEHGMNAHLVIGPGFDALKFLGSFYPRAYRHVRAHVTAIEW